MAKPQLEVTGKAEVVRAFDKLSGEMENLEDVNAEVGQRLIGDIRNATRRKTGALRDAWIADGTATAAMFSNPQDYAVVQEMGGKQIAATHAVKQAYEGNADAITKAYADGTKRRAKRANIRTA